MPSFDIVSEVDEQHVDNAVMGVHREVKQRYDFKGSNSSIERSGLEITIIADDDYKLNAMQEMLRVHATRHKMDSKSFDFSATPQKASGNTLRHVVSVQKGINSETAKKIVKDIKGKKFKVQASIRGEELRVDGKKRDDLQQVINFVKELDLSIPVQFINFRD